MDNYSQLKKDITLTYMEILEEKENFTGHYEGNPYNGINIFGNNIYVGSYNSSDILSNPKSPEYIIIGVAICQLCKLAQIHSDAFDNDMNPIDIIKSNESDTYKQLNNGVYDNLPMIKNAIKNAYENSVEFSQSLLVVLDQVVSVQSKQLTRQFD